MASAMTIGGDRGSHSGINLRVFAFFSCSGVYIWTIFALLRKADAKGSHLELLFMHF